MEQKGRFESHMRQNFSNNQNGLTVSKVCSGGMDL